MNVLKGAVAASVAVFVWSFIFWWSPLPYMAVDKISEDEDRAEEVIRYLQAELTESGTYMIPSPHDHRSVLRALRGTGPAITIYVLARDQILPGWLTLSFGFGRVFLAMLMFGFVLKTSLPSLRPTYSARLKFVTLTAVAAVIYKDLADSIWWYQPWPWSLVKSSYDLVAWILGGLLLAAIIRPLK